MPVDKTLQNANHQTISFRAAYKYNEGEDKYSDKDWSETQSVSDSDSLLEDETCVEQSGFFM